MFWHFKQCKTSDNRNNILNGVCQSNTQRESMEPPYLHSFQLYEFHYAFNGYQFDDFKIALDGFIEMRIKHKLFKYVMGLGLGTEWWWMVVGV